MSSKFNKKEKRVHKKYEKFFVFLTKPFLKEIK